MYVVFVVVFNRAFQALGSASSRKYCNLPVDPPPVSQAASNEQKLSGFAKSYEKFAALDFTKEKNIDKPKSSKSFVSLLRNSKFMQVSALV